MCNRLDTIPACDGQTDGRTDGQTSCHGIVRVMHTRRAVKTARKIFATVFFFSVRFHLEGWYEKNRVFQPKSRFISETIKDMVRPIVTMEDK